MPHACKRLSSSTKVYIQIVHGLKLCEICVFTHNPKQSERWRQIGFTLTLSTTTTRRMFLSSRSNACLADVQKLCPYMAHMMYAFRLMNRKNLFNNQKKHRIHVKMARVNALSYFFNFTSIHSSMARMKLQIAMIRDPKATVPKWYLRNKNSISDENNWCYFK